jgi:putative tryptophan/tyrosine transport system substrate-binding protein
LDLDGNFFQLLARTITTKSLPASRQNILMLIPTTPFNSDNLTRICQLALRYRIPAISERPDWAKNGLLQDSVWSETRAMDYVDKILRGAKPSELPVEQATKLELVINLKTAKELGLTVPPSLIARADEVIE